jgi:hypothetical protein
MDVVALDTRVCKKCGPRAASEFYAAKDPRSKGGIRYFCKDCKNERENARRLDLGQARLDYLKDYRARVRGLVLSHYSAGKNECASCHESCQSFLCVDHVNDDGYLKQGKTCRAGSSLYGWLFKNDFPPGFQILCHNCNYLKELALCASSSRYSEYGKRLRDEVLSHYGKGDPKCACCGPVRQEALCVDHEFGGGNIERAKMGRLGFGRDFYRWLIRNGFPDGYRLLCHNCNFAFGANGSCPHSLTGWNGN